MYFIFTFLQLFHDAVITRNARFEMPNASVHSLLSKYWELFSSKAPKGFGKFYGEDDKSKKPNDPPKKQSSDKELEQTLDKEFNDFEKKIDRLFFKEKAKSTNGGGNGKGRPIGGGDNGSKYFLAGLGAFALIGLGTMYYSYYAQTEISWKEFIG